MANISRTPPPPSRLSAPSTTSPTPPPTVHTPGGYPSTSKAAFSVGSSVSAQEENLPRSSSPTEQGAFSKKPPAPPLHAKKSADVLNMPNVIREKKSTVSNGQVASASNPLGSIHAPDVVDVGAGPVGLWTAIQTKLIMRKEGEDTEWKFFEKYENYQRDNFIRVHSDRFSKCEKDSFGIIAQLEADLKENPFIAIQDLEERLRTLAEKLGVEITVVSGGIENFQNEVIDAYPTAKLFIGSDGANSQFRQQLFPEINRSEESLKYAVQVKYEVEGEAPQLGNLELLPVRQHNTYHSAYENIGKVKENGKTSVMLQIFVDSETYQNLKEKATFKKPIYLFQKKPIENTVTKGGAGDVPSGLMNDIKALMGLRFVKHGSRFDPATVRLSVTEIGQSHCDIVVKEKDGKVLALQGDSALRLPFFQGEGLNSGLELAGEFAKTAANYLSKKNTPSSKTVTQNAKKARSNSLFQGYQNLYTEYADKKTRQARHTKDSLVWRNAALELSTKIPALNYGRKKVQTYRHAIDNFIENLES